MAPGSESIHLEPINVSNAATLPRHPTLEAQREPSIIPRRSNRWIIAFSDEDIPDDATEQKLKDARSKSDGDVRRHLSGLLSDYSRLKDNMSYGIGDELSRCFTVTDDSQDGVVKSMNSSVDLDVSGLKIG